jgi:hypothetical protein
MAGQHRLRKSSVAIPVGGTNATNHHWASSLRSASYVPEEEKNELHNSLLEADHLSDMNLSASEIRRKQLMDLRKSLRQVDPLGQTEKPNRSGKDLNSNRPTEILEEVYSDGQEKNQTDSFYVNGGYNPNIVRNSNASTAFHHSTIRGNPSAHTVQEDRIVRLEAMNMDQKQYAKEKNVESEKVSSALIPSTPSDKSELVRFKLDSPALRAHNNQTRQTVERIGADGSTDWGGAPPVPSIKRYGGNMSTVLEPPSSAGKGVLGGSSTPLRKYLKHRVSNGIQQMQNYTQAMTNDELNDSHVSTEITMGKISSSNRQNAKPWMPPSPGRYTASRTGGGYSLTPKDQPDNLPASTRADLRAIKRQQKQQNKLLRILSESQNLSNPNTIELLALAESNSDLAHKLEDVIEEKGAIQLQLQLEREKSQMLELRFAEMVDICKEEEENKIKAEESAKGFLEELRKLERLNVRNLGNAHREGENARRLEQKNSQLLSEKATFEEKLRQTQLAAEEAKQREEVKGNELDELRKQADSLRSENERIVEKMGRSTLSLNDQQRRVIDLEDQLGKTRKELSTLASLQTEINRAQSEKESAIVESSLKQFERKQRHIENIARKQYAELQDAKEEVSRLQLELKQEKNLDTRSKETALMIHSEIQKELEYSNQLVHKLKAEIAEATGSKSELVEKVRHLQQDLEDSKRRTAKAQNAVSSINQANMNLREECRMLEMQLQQSF